VTPEDVTTEQSSEGGLVGSARRDRWVPPPRPEWLAKMNAEGEYFDLKRVVPLDPDSLISAAKDATGLEDFGEDDWREPFQILCKALDEEAELNLMGRLMTRSDLLITLEARLRVEADYKAHPEIEDEEITKPLLIVGQGRSGTSMLQSLLAADPNNGTFRNWEALFPSPPPEKETYETDPRIRKADGLTTMWNRVTPEIQSMHHFTGWVPTENIHVQCMSFMSPNWFDLFGQTPTYFGAMLQRDQADPYRYEKRVLKLLQWKNPRTTWVMKSPAALQHLPSVLDVYPDVGFIWTHRDPVKAVSSVVSLIGTLHWMRSDEPFIGGSQAQYTNPDLAAGMMSQPIKWLEEGTLPRERLCNIQYSDLIGDTMGAVQQIYDFFELELTDEGRAAMEEHLDRDRRSDRPAHKYDLGSEDEIEMEREAFKQYQEYFGVANEI
jgi:Sulfotransferase family